MRVGELSMHHLVSMSDSKATLAWDEFQKNFEATMSMYKLLTLTVKISVCVTVGWSSVSHQIFMQSEVVVN